MRSLTSRRSVPTPRRRRWPLVGAAAFVIAAMLVRPSLAPATVEEQRKRLPPPARDCNDPVTGQWMGHQYLRDHWNRFVLHIDRVEPGSEELKGEITSFFWEAPIEVDTPPPCEELPGDQIKGLMPAQGSFRGNRIEFIGQSYQVVEVPCGSARRYFPDAFSGELSEDGTEFISTNDDGHNPLIPVVFRRIACADPKRPTPELPPPRTPPAYTQSCSCF